MKAKSINIHPGKRKKLEICQVALQRVPLSLSPSHLPHSPVPSPCATDAINAGELWQPAPSLSPFYYFSLALPPSLSFSLNAPRGLSLITKLRASISCTSRTRWTRGRRLVGMAASPPSGHHQRRW